MKRFSMYVLALLVSGALFVACDDDDNDKLTFDKSNIELVVSESVAVKVSGGKSPYTATVPDAGKEFVEVKVDGSTITITGKKQGNTSVQVKDKDGLDASIAVQVKNDPFEAEKTDPTVRVKWDAIDKKAGGENAGVFSLKKDADKKEVTFSWQDKPENAAESVVITFKDTNDAIIAAAAQADGTKMSLATGVGKVTVKKGEETKNYDITALRLVQAKPGDDKEGTPNTYWVAFKANNKDGLFVAPLDVDETPAE